MDDLIKRLEAETQAIMGPAGADYSVEPVSFYMEAAAALSEAQATIARLEAALREARDAAHSFAHDGYDGVWSEADFAELTPLADALLSPREGEGT